MCVNHFYLEYILKKILDGQILNQNMLTAPLYILLGLIHRATFGKSNKLFSTGFCKVKHIVILKIHSRGFIFQLLIGQLNTIFSLVETDT